MEFSTFDADNDKWYGINCAGILKGGFWWESCGEQNINGQYSGNYEPYPLIWWDDHINLKTSQMMIRPAAKN